MSADPKTTNALHAKLQQAVALHRQGQTAAAEVLYREVLAVDPRQANALYLSGAIAAARNDKAAAADLIGRALAVDPGIVGGHFSLGRLLAALGRFDEALAAFDTAVAQNPNHDEAHDCRGQMLHHLGRFEAAREAYDRALALMPGVAEVHNNRAAALAALKYLPAAVEGYDRAVALKPDYTAAYVNRGHTLVDLGRLEDAAASYAAALRLDEHFPFLRGSRLHARLKACVWDGLEADLADVRHRIMHGAQAASPWVTLALYDDPALHRRAAEIWAQASCPPQQADAPQPPPHDKIRIGYFSADFHDHATCHLMAELFERHDRNRFELTAFSFGPDTGDAVRKRVAAAFDRFLDVRAMSDAEIAALSRKHGIDIAVDLKGHTQDTRMGIFARRAAPVQASYIGYPGTVGVGYIDYVIADATVIPESARAHYTEKVVALPGSYQVNDSRRKIADRVFSRAELELPEQAFVFCCFNHGFKILPETFGLWMRILKAVPGSVLWLLEEAPVAAANLRKEAEARGVDGARLVFAKRMPLAEHLSRLRAADLFLDTLPYNAHTTASDALWAGVPIVTRLGAAFAGRVAASLLQAVGLPELVTDTAEAYAALAVDLARNPARLLDIKRKLAEQRAAAPLFDAGLFARNIEAAYTRMMARHHNGQPPDHITL
jgi:protein O-GlcNAc transferase